MRISTELRTVLVDIKHFLCLLPGVQQAHFIHFPPDPSETEFIQLREMLCLAADLMADGTRTTGRTKMLLKPKRYVDVNAIRQRRRATHFEPLPRERPRPGAFH